MKNPYSWKRWFIALLVVLAVMVATVMVVALKASAATTAVGPTLRSGSTGHDVATLQLYLNCSARGDFFAYPRYTGNFGSVTVAGLKQHEVAVGRTVDGRIRVNGHEWAQLADEATAKHCFANIDPRSVQASIREGHAVDLSKADLKVRILRHGRIWMQADVRVGDKRGPQYVTREGAFRIFAKGGKNFRSSLFKGSDGLGILMPYPVFFSGGQAIHYSYEFAQYGYARPSHGCAGVRDMQAAIAFHALPMGTVVISHH